MFHRGVSLSCYQSNKEFSEWSYNRIKEVYPDTVDQARDMIIEYLSKHDKQRLLVFLGEVADENGDAYNLHESFYLICDLLQDEDNAFASLSQIDLDVILHGYLQIPFATIVGGTKH